jgi:hypothetical protein
MEDALDLGRKEEEKWCVQENRWEEEKEKESEKKGNQIKSHEGSTACLPSLSWPVVHHTISIALSSLLIHSSLLPSSIYLLLP